MPSTRQLGWGIASAALIMVAALIGGAVSPPGSGPSVLRIVVFVMGGCVVVLGIMIFFAETGDVWRARNPAVTIGIERIEKACDAVISILAFLIPATALLATWLHDAETTDYVKLVADPQLRIAKLTGVDTFSYAAVVNTCVMLSVTSFVVVVIFTLYLRFNFIFGIDRVEVKIGTGGEARNIRVVYWATAVMVFMTMGLFLLAVPIFLVMTSRH